MDQQIWKVQASAATAIDKEDKPFLSRKVGAGESYCRELQLMPALSHLPRSTSSRKVAYRGRLRTANQTAENRSRCPTCRDRRFARNLPSWEAWLLMVSRGDLCEAEAEIEQNLGKWQILAKE